MLNKIWISFFFIAFFSALFQWLFNGDGDIFARIINSVFDMSKVTVDIAIGLIGILSFWLGMMKVAEKAGVINKLSHWISPLFTRLMPDVPKGHPAMGSMTMNLSANFLGLDNAATPLGLKAMKDLQSLNPNKDTATDAQILFLVLNTSSVTLFPIAVFVYRAQQGAANPTDVFIPILLATFASSFAGLLVVAYKQKIQLMQKVVLLYFSAGIAVLLALIIYFAQLSADALSSQSSLLGNALIFGTIIAFISAAMYRKVDVYDAFISGAKEGFETSIKLIPYLLAMLVAIGVLRASGALDLIVDICRTGLALLGFNTLFVDALPTAFMKPCSANSASCCFMSSGSSSYSPKALGSPALKWPLK